MDQSSSLLLFNAIHIHRCQHYNGMSCILLSSEKRFRKIGTRSRELGAEAGVHMHSAAQVGYGKGCKGLAWVTRQEPNLCLPGKLLSKSKHPVPTKFLVVELYSCFVPKWNRRQTGAPGAWLIGHGAALRHTCMHGRRLEFDTAYKLLSIDVQERMPAGWPTLKTGGAAKRYWIRQRL